MADETAVPTKGVKERSPSFPFIPLPTALNRLEQFEAYFGRHPAKADLAGLAWQMKGGSSKSQQTLAALKYFGFVEYKGAGKDRVAILTELARTYLRAQQDSIKRDVVRKAALRPTLIRRFFHEWGADRPPDPVCLDQLVLHNGFNEGAASLFLKVYDQTIAFAGLSDSDKGGTASHPSGETEEEDAEDDTDPGTPPKAIKVGDLVQREANGVLTFPAPRKVKAVFHDQQSGWMVSVDGYAGAFPMSEIQPFAATGVAPTAPNPAGLEPAEVETPEKDPIETFLANGRLQINANVGLEGIGRLKQMLDKYEELLKLMS